MRQSLQMRAMAAPAVLLALLLAACGGDVTMRGRVSDAVGTQRAQQGGLGGGGTVVETRLVRVSRVEADGALRQLAETPLQTEGRFVLSVPADAEVLVLQAVDAAGTVRAGALLEGSGEAGGTVVAPPLDGEGLLEAEVYAQALRAGAEAGALDPVDLRARLDARVAAAALAGSAELRAAWVLALAQAVRAAQEAELRSYAAAGVRTQQAHLLEAERGGAARLNAALEAGDNAAQAYEDFYVALGAAAQRVGAEPHEHALAQSSASAAFRVSLEALLPGPEAASLVDAAVRAAGSLEARSCGAALGALLRAAGAPDATRAQAARTATRLLTQVDAAGSAADAAQAFSRFSASVATEPSAQATVLGGFLGVGPANAAGVNLAVQAATTEGATLDGVLEGVAGSTASAEGRVDEVALAAATAEAFDTFASGLRHQAPVLSAFGDRRTPAMELLVLAEGAFRAGR